MVVGLGGPCDDPKPGSGVWRERTEAFVLFAQTLAICGLSHDLRGVTEAR